MIKIIKGYAIVLLWNSFHDRIFRPIVNSSGAYLFSLFTTTVLFCLHGEEGPWSPFDYCHILEVFAVPVVTQPVLSAFVMAAALGLLRVRRAGGLRSDEPLEKTAHRLLCEWRRCRHVLRQTINLLLEKDSKFSIVSIEYRVYGETYY